MDILGTIPTEVDYTTTPPTISEADEWIPTYDFHAAAADIWEEKASAVADEFDFSADGGNYKRNQKYESYLGKARYHLSRRKANTITQYVEPRIVQEEEDNSD